MSEESQNKDFMSPEERTCWTRFMAAEDAHASALRDYQIAVAKLNRSNLSGEESVKLEQEARDAGDHASRLWIEREEIAVEWNRKYNIRQNTIGQDVFDGLSLSISTAITRGLRRIIRPSDDELLKTLEEMVDRLTANQAAKDAPKDPAP